MLGWLQRNASMRRTGQDLYERIVAQARHEAFYRDGGVPDTMEGRFEMIALHLVLVLERLRGEGQPGQRLGQLLIERLVADMDDALRQIGIGDMGVPRRVKKAAAALAERARDYGVALSAAPEGRADDPLAAHLLAHVFGTGGPDSRMPDAAVTAHAVRLAAYVRTCAARLAREPGPAVLAGRLDFADPTAVGAGPS